MAKCPGCPAIKEFPDIAAIEYYAVGDGCPDEDFDIYGGDCYFANFGDEEFYDDEDFDKFELYYDCGEEKAEKKGGR